MYKVKDNAEAQLQFGISSVATTLVVKEGQGVKFPEVPFLVVLNKRNSDGEITKSEKVEVSAVSGDQFTISRGYEGTTPSDFSADDFVSLFVLAKHIEELQTEVVKKANQTEVESVAQRTDSLEEKITTAEGKISQLVEAGTPSYLGITGIVGEKYTMEDTLFLQKTPSFADSTIAINVGDTNANKEQHIQRIGSGTASNQLKLKMKKFGAPTTSVIVEVRKGIKVDVSDKEAYRYGGEVVATTTIAYTQFTTEWKELTLTLNNQFGATKGELLDIVVYQQGGIVNGTNYYQIACDSTQYSEAFSVVAVNGSSRVRDKLMPYCVSDALASGLLAKKGPFLSHKNGNKYRLFVNRTGNGRYKSTDISIGKRIYVSGEINSGRYHSNRGTIKIFNGTKLKHEQSGVNTTSPSFESDTFLVEGSTNINVEITNNDGYPELGDIAIFSSGFPKNGASILPRELRQIGAQTGCTLFGTHINGEFLSNIDTTISQAAITGSIPPANAVGYMTITDTNGKKYKIRVYGE